MEAQNHVNKLDQKHLNPFRINKGHQYRPLKLQRWPIHVTLTENRTKWFISPYKISWFPISYDKAIFRSTKTTIDIRHVIKTSLILGSETLYRSLSQTPICNLCLYLPNVLKLEVLYPFLLDIWNLMIGFMTPDTDTLSHGGISGDKLADKLTKDVENIQSTQHIQ